MVVREMIAAHHDRIVQEHCVVYKTMEIVKSRYWIPNVCNIVQQNVLHHL